MGKGSDIEGNGKAALLCPFQVARSTHLHVFFCQVKAVLRCTHQFKPLAGFLADLVAMHQHTVRFLASAADPSAQLMKLGKPEPFCVLDDHYGGIGDIYSYLDHSGRHKDVRPAGSEGIHVESLHVARLLAVDDGHLVFRHGETAYDLFIACFQILVIQFLTLEDQRIDYEDLAAGIYLLAYEIVHRRALSLPYQHCLDRLPSGRHLIYYRDIKVSIESHCKSSGNRCSRHDKDMGR